MKRNTRTPLTDKEIIPILKHLSLLPKKPSPTKKMDTNDNVFEPLTPDSPNNNNSNDSTTDPPIDNNTVNQPIICSSLPAETTELVAALQFPQQTSLATTLLPISTNLKIAKTIPKDLPVKVNLNVEPNFTNRPSIFSRMSTHPNMYAQPWTVRIHPYLPVHQRLGPIPLSRINFVMRHPPTPLNMIHVNRNNHDAPCCSHHHFH
ncbi:unnamed protein product [Meloidogyne enterolobii]|uniref:Uncharacterized protein n=1 Tax=Meloidogyne enterolobii TaxID=390850 RepID=A0ACB0XP73_MELEN